MSDKRANRLAEAERLLGEFSSLRDRADVHVKATGVPSQDPSIATALELRKIAGDQIETVSQLRGQLSQGNGFLAGFSLWMSQSNLRRCKALMAKAEAERRKIISNHEAETGV